MAASAEDREVIDKLLQDAGARARAKEEAAAQRPRSGAPSQRVCITLCSSP